MASTPKRRFVVEGKIFKKSKHSENYTVLLIPPGQINFSKDLTPATDANRTHTCDKSHRSKYFIPFTVEGRLISFKDKVLVSLIIHLAMAVVSFLHFCIFSKRLVFTSLQEVFVRK